MNRKQGIILAIVAMLWIGGALSYFLTSGEKDIEALFVIINGLGVIAAVFATILNSLNHQALKNEELRTRRFEMGFRYAEKWMVDPIASARKKTREVMSSESEPNALVKMIEEDEEMRHSAVVMTNYWQTIHFIIEQGLADTDAVKHFLGPPFKAWLDKFRPWLETQRPKDPHLFEDLEDLYERWNSLAAD
jgi:hypothetical protein